MIDRQVFKRSLLKIIGVSVGLGLGMTSLWSYEQPPLNMSATTFLDGGAPRGFYYLNYSIFVNGEEPMDGNGNVKPGDAHVNVLTQLHQFYYHSSLRFLGADAGFMVAVPLVAVSSRGTFPSPGGPIPLVSDTAGLGDLVVAPALHWDGKSFLGSPVFYRLEFDVTLPTGRYAKDGAIDAGSNLTTYDPYFSVVWMFRPKWETSWRFFYTVNSENPNSIKGTVEPGRAFHLNYAVSREVLPKWRLGVAGYYLQQLTEDRIDGVKQMNSEERVASAGPGFAYMGDGLTAMFSYPIEFSVENRFEGSRATLQLIHKF